MMEKVKFPFKYFQNSVNESFMLNTMIEKTIKFAKHLSRRRGLVFEKAS